MQSGIRVVFVFVEVGNLKLLNLPQLNCCLLLLLLLLTSATTNEGNQKVKTKLDMFCSHTEMIALHLLNVFACEQRVPGQTQKRKLHK